MAERLSREAAAIIAEEEALLARARSCLQAAARAPRADAAANRLEAYEALRDEVNAATEGDLPSLLGQLNDAHALAGRSSATARPDPATPYFAHLRVRDERGRRDYLLGRASFSATAAGVRIVDWRFAPVARIFYAYQEGDAYEERLPGGASEGEVEARRVVVIERGVLTRILSGGQVLARDADGTWREERGVDTHLAPGGAGTATRPGALGLAADGRPDVTALLDPEQFAAIHAPADEPLLVLGSAGSGKTTVALHRLARLRFDEPRRFPDARMRVLVPEEGLARLSKRLLEPLGLGAVPVDTAARWIVRSAQRAFGVKAIKIAPETPALVARLKRHPALQAPLLERLGAVRAARASLRALRRTLADPLTDRGFLARVVEASRGDLPATAVEETVRHTMLQLATPLAREFEGYDPERKRALDDKPLEEGTPDALAGTYDLEDLALLLYLKARAGALEPESLAHLVVDEAEDFSLFESAILREQLGDGRSCTLAGDEMQQTHSSFGGWSATLAALGLEGAATVRLQTSYRCPRPVVELAHRVLGAQAPEEAPCAAREGAPVGWHHFPSEAQGLLFLAGALRDLTDREPRASVAVIAGNAETAQAIFAALSAVPSTRLVLDGAFGFEPGVDVTTVDAVKGLEFDYVIIPDAHAREYPDAAEARRRLHVAVTRASHQLWLVSTGSATPLVRSASDASRA